jgi:arginyl-tRNA synthetase
MTAEGAGLPTKAHGAWLHGTHSLRVTGAILGFAANLSEEEVRDIGLKIALAATRFSDLQNTRTTDYKFDLERFTSFEGKTGPYLLYAAVRIKALLRRAKGEGNAAGTIRIVSDTERKLAMQMDGFNTALEQAFEKRMPHFLCEHIYNLAQAFSAFYAAHPIAAEKDAELRASRLGLCEAVLHQLETGLDILGIKTPERM